MTYGHLKTGYGIVHKDILSNKNLDAYSIKIYAILAAYQGGSSHCFPSIDYISKTYNMDRKTVMSRIKVLEDEKILTKQKTKAGNKYHVMQPIMTKDEIENPKPENQQVPSQGTYQVPSQGTYQVPPDGTLRITNKINNKNNIKDDELNELKKTAKSLGSYIKIRKDIIVKHLNYYSLNDVKGAIISASEHNKKNNIKTWLSKGHIEYYKSHLPGRKPQAEAKDSYVEFEKTEETPVWF